MPDNNNLNNPNRAGRRVTIKDVAAHVNVHHSSVSVVLNGSRSNTIISHATRRRILEAAEELGYQRNGSAHTIRTGRFGNVGLLLSSKSNKSYLPPQLLAGMHDALAEADRTLIVCQLADEQLSDENVIPKILRERMCDGLLIDYTKTMPQAAVNSIQRHQLPAIWINSKREADCVYSDDFEAAEQAAKYLIKLGHRRIAYADFQNHLDKPQNYPQDHYSTLDRRWGYEAAMKEAGLEPIIWGWDPYGDDEIAFCSDALRSPQRPTAVIGYSTIAIEGLGYALAALGYRVPDDLSVICFGPEQHKYMCTPATMLIEPQYEIAQIATRMILEKIESASESTTSQAVKFHLQEGKTTAPPSTIKSSKQTSNNSPNPPPAEPQLRLRQKVCSV
jgi:DNA-binding LacI/PurR family transcriptional regulator